MKKLVLLLLTALLLLTGIAGATELALSPYADEDFCMNGDIELYPYLHSGDFPWFDTDFACIEYFLVVCSQDARQFAFTDEYTLEKQINGTWYLLPFSEKANFLGEAVHLRYGQEWKSTIMQDWFDIDWFDGDWVVGEYRLVMKINGKPYQMPFRIDERPSLSKSGLWPTIHVEPFAEGPVKFAFPEKGYAQNAAKIAYTVENTGNESIIYDNVYGLEIWEEGGWYQIPFYLDAWPSRQYAELPAGSTETLYINKAHLEIDTLPAGRYRVIRGFADLLYAAEFEIYPES